MDQSVGSRRVRLRKFTYFEAKREWEGRISPLPQKNFYILLFFHQPGLQSFESTQLTQGWLSQILHLNKGPGKER